MSLLGVHTSIAGGFHHALLRAQALGCTAVQMFLASPGRWPVTPPPAGKPAFRPGEFLTKNCNQWNAKDLTAEEIRTFRRTLRQTRLCQPMAHVCYLMNLDSSATRSFRSP
jgi:deoxyribonuclease-4